MELKNYLNSRGGGKQLGAALKVSQVIISQWKTGARQVPADRCIEIERATAGAVRCEELRPDVDWAYLRAVKSQKLGAGDTPSEPHQEAA